VPFTNVFDNTFPPDTQLANLLGDDIRKFKVDIQQRVAALSGLDASKPNFAGDTQPSAWNGILYFATDTGKIYQFNNPSWTDVTGSFKTPATKFANSTPVTLGAAGDLQTITIPGGTFAVGSQFLVHGCVIFNSTSAVVTVNLTIAGIQVALSIPNVASNNGVVTFFARGVIIDSTTEWFMTDAVWAPPPGSGTFAARTANSVGSLPVSGPIVVKTSVSGSGTFTATGELLLIEVI